MKKILLADDDPLILEIYRRRLQAAGFHVETASDGLVAMKLLYSAVPDVVVLDVMMPKFSGLEVLKYVHSVPALAEVRVIILSNMYFGGEQRQAVTHEPDQALAKSECTPAILVAAIQEVLATPRAKAATPSPAAPAPDVDRRLPS